MKKNLALRLDFKKSSGGIFLDNDSFYEVHLTAKTGSKEAVLMIPIEDCFEGQVMNLDREHSTLYIRRLSDCEAYEQLENMIQIWISEANQAVPNEKGKISEGVVYLVKNGDAAFRAVVIAGSPSTCILMYKIDVGILEFCDWEEIYELPANMKKIPPLCFRVKLASCNDKCANCDGVLSVKDSSVYTFALEKPAFDNAVGQGNYPPVLPARIFKSELDSSRAECFVEICCSGSKVSTDLDEDIQEVKQATIAKQIKNGGADVEDEFCQALFGDSPFDAAYSSALSMLTSQEASSKKSEVNSSAVISGGVPSLTQISSLESETPSEKFASTSLKRSHVEEPRSQGQQSDFQKPVELKSSTECNGMERSCSKGHFQLNSRKTGANRRRFGLNIIDNDGFAKSEVRASDGIFFSHRHKQSDYSSDSRTNTSGRRGRPKRPCRASNGSRAADTSNSTNSFRNIGKAAASKESTAVLFVARERDENGRIIYTSDESSSSEDCPELEDNISEKNDQEKVDDQEAELDTDRMLDINLDLFNQQFSKSTKESGSAVIKYRHLFEYVKVTCGQTEVVRRSDDDSANITWPLFFVQIQKNELINFLEENLDTLQPEIVLPENNLEIGTLCVSYCRTFDSMFRAVITEVTGEQVEVYYVDYGNYEFVSAKDLKAIEDQSEEARTHPGMAVPCILESLESVSVSFAEDEKLKEAVSCDLDSFRLRFIRVRSDGVYVVQLDDQL